MNNFVIFLCCAACGAVSGIVYDFLYVLRLPFTGADKSEYTAAGKIIVFICDLIYFSAFAAAYVFMSVALDFTSLRLFMLAGCALGAIIYLKSFHLILAFFIKKVYNRVNKYNKRKEN